MVTPRTCFTAVRQRDVAALLPRHFAEQPFIVWLVANFVSAPTVPLCIFTETVLTV